MPELPLWTAAEKVMNIPAVKSHGGRLPGTRDLYGTFHFPLQTGHRAPVTSPLSRMGQMYFHVCSYWGNAGTFFHRFLAVHRNK